MLDTRYIQQRSPEWHEAKLGKLTASNMDSALYFKQNGSESKERYDLKIQILAERLTGVRASVFNSIYMQNGVTNEPVAKEVIQQLGFSIEEVGFFDHPTIINFGASPDGLTKDGGVIEIKCPKTETHLKYILAGIVPNEYKPQMLAQIACTGRKFADFISFDPRIKNKEMQVFARRFTPSEKEIKAIEKAAIQFLSEVSNLEKFLGEAF